MTISHKQLAQYSAQSYSSHTISVDNVECLIIPHEEYTVVAIRGTEKITKKRGLIDWLRDLLIVPKKYHTLGWCHAGFGDGAWDIAMPILSQLDPLKPVVITGHSAGGIIALMVAKILHSKGINVIEWVGFGSPRGFIGNLEWPFKLTAYRHGKDIVTYVPTLGYCHQVKLSKLPNSSWYPNVADHGLAHYIEKLSSQSN